MVYAQHTKVGINQSKAEIERLIMKHGADNLASFSSKDKNIIAFEYKNKRIIFHLPLPTRGDKSFYVTASGRRRLNEAAATEAWEQACRSKWRALFLTIKAKLESIEAGIETFEEAFLAHIMTPDGHKFADVAIPQIESAYSDGRPVAPLLSDLR